MGEQAWAAKNCDYKKKKKIKNSINSLLSVNWIRAQKFLKITFPGEIISNFSSLAIEWSWDAVKTPYYFLSTVKNDANSSF